MLRAWTVACGVLNCGNDDGDSGEDDDDDDDDDNDVNDDGEDSMLTVVKYTYIRSKY